MFKEKVMMDGRPVLLSYFVDYQRVLKCRSYSPTLVKKVKSTFFSKVATLRPMLEFDRPGVLAHGT